MFFMKPKKKNNALKIIAIIAGCVAAVAAIAVLVAAICKKKCKKNECCKNIPKKRQYNAQCITGGKA